MAIDIPPKLTIEAMQARIDLRKRQQTEAMIETHPFQAQIALDNICVSLRQQQAQKELKAKEEAVYIRAVREIHIRKDLYRLNFYNELYFDPAKTVAHAQNSGDGCRVLIECYRTFNRVLREPFMLSAREHEFLMTLCGQCVEIPIGTIESQIVFKLAKISEARFHSDAFAKLHDVTVYFSEKIHDMLKSGDYPVPGNMLSQIVMVHCMLIEEVRKHFKFKIEQFCEYNTTKYFQGLGRYLYSELRRYFAKKLWELRQRARQLDELEAGLPLEVTYSEEDKKELLFYRNHLAQVEKQLKDSNSQLKSAGIIESGANKLSRAFAHSHEVDSNLPTTKAPNSEQPKKTQSVDDETSKQPKQDKPENINVCQGFVQKGIFPKDSISEGYRKPVPDWLFRIQQQKRLKREAEASTKATKERKSKLYTDLKQAINGPTEDTSPQPQSGQNKDLKALQTWAIPTEPTKLADFKPNPADLEHEIVKHFERAERWAELLEMRKEIREKRVNLLKHLKNKTDARNRKIREEKQKRVKKPEKDEKQKE